MSALRKLISGSSKAGACGGHVLEMASRHQGSLYRELASRRVHASPALQKCLGAAAMSEQPGRAGLRTSLPLTKPAADRPATPPPQRPQVRVDPSLLNLQQSSDQPPRSGHDTANNPSKDSRNQWTTAMD